MGSPSLQVITALVLTSALAAPAAAQEEPAPPFEVASLRLRYGAAFRVGEQSDTGPGLGYQGLTPNDFAGSGRFWFMPNVGAGLSAQREGFALNTSDPTPVRVSSGAVLRITAGPAGRLILGPITLEALLGYQLVQLPFFGNTRLLDQVFTTINRHSAVGAGRAAVELPLFGARLELRGEYPLPLVTSLPSGETPTTSTGLSGGASLVVPLGLAGTFQYSLVADYQYIEDAVTIGPKGSETFVARQALQRGGVGLQFDILDHAPAPRLGTVLVRALDAESGQPLAGAAVALNVAGRDFQARPGGPAGSFSAQDLPPGAVVAKVTAGGYLPGEGKATVVAGQEATIDVRVKKEPPKTGALLVTLVDKVSKAPIAGATVRVRGQEKQTSDQGTVTFEGLLPGPAPVEASVPDYHPVSEVASIVALRTAELPLPLVKARAAILATITGLVRNRSGGRPISAQLEIPEARMKTKAAGSSGAFTFRIQGGTYSLIISAPGFITQTKTVTVKDGDQAIYNVDLSPNR